MRKMGGQPVASSLTLLLRTGLINDRHNLQISTHTRETMHAMSPILFAYISFAVFLSAKAFRMLREDQTYKSMGED